VSRSKDEYNDYMRTYMLERYHSRRAESYATLGGKCVVCGSCDDLQIDHIDPATKTLNIAKLWSVSRERYIKELELCQLLCGVHHRQKTSVEQGVPHGGGISGKKNCYCGLCAPKKRKYQRERRRKSRASSLNEQNPVLLPRESLGSNPRGPT
jgi:hypothetical protein